MTDSTASVENRFLSLPWRHALIALALALVAILLSFFDAAHSLVSDWMKYATYTHGVLILPISLWLIWEKRVALSQLNPRPDFFGLAVLVAVLIAMSLATLASVKVAQQFGLIAVIVITVWTLLGRRVARFLAFPLLFMFLAVPMGRDLVPPMMEFTASFTVSMLQFTGIPVYREGLFFRIPSGNWSVVEACSGLRYLIASVTLGLLYAYLTYSSLWRRLLFVAMSIVVPIIANGLRAYMIVMIGHLSDMKLAVGVDHLLYGWVFFGLVMLLLFWVGSFWSETPREPDMQALNKGVGPSPGGVFYRAMAMVLVAVVSLVLLTSKLQAYDPGMSEVLAAPEPNNGWRLDPQASWPWPDLPSTLDTEHRVTAMYRKGDHTVGLTVALFPKQAHAADAVSVTNEIFVPETGWNIVSRDMNASLADSDVRVNRFELARNDLPHGLARPTLLQWYRLGSRSTASEYVGKIYTALNLFYPRRTDGAYIVVVSASEDLGEEIHPALSAFMRDVGPAAIDHAIDKAVLGTTYNH